MSLATSLRVALRRDQAQRYAAAIDPNNPANWGGIDPADLRGSFVTPIGGGSSHRGRRTVQRESDLVRLYRRGVLDTHQYAAGDTLARLMRLAAGLRGEPQGRPAWNRVGVTDRQLEASNQVRAALRATAQVSAVAHDVVVALCAETRTLAAVALSLGRVDRAAGRVYGRPKALYGAARDGLDAVDEVLGRAP